MEIKTKYDIGQKVWCVRQSSRPVVCKYCGGSGSVKFVGFANAFGDANVTELDEPITCPVCNGREIKEREEYFEAEWRYVSRVNTSTRYRGRDGKSISTIMYTLIADSEDLASPYIGEEMEERGVFATKEEAVRAIEQHRVRAKEHGWLCYVDEEVEAEEVAVVEQRG